MSDTTLEYEEKRSVAAQFFRNLTLDLLASAALDLSRPEPDPTDGSLSAAAQRAEREFARQWVTGAPTGVSFELCCDAINVSVDALRRALLTEPAQVLNKVREIAASWALETDGKVAESVDSGAAPDGEDTVPAARSTLSRPR